MMPPTRDIWQVSDSPLIRTVRNDGGSGDYDDGSNNDDDNDDTLYTILRHKYWFIYQFCAN